MKKLLSLAAFATAMAFEASATQAGFTPPNLIY